MANVTLNIKYKIAWWAKPLLYIIRAANTIGYTVEKQKVVEFMKSNAVKIYINGKRSRVDGRS